jgi:hypothetical protein
MTKEINHKEDKISGTRELVANFPLVKPKIERLTSLEGVTKEDINEFVGEKKFLQKNHGVR